MMPPVEVPAIEIEILAIGPPTRLERRRGSGGKDALDAPPSIVRCAAS